MLAHDGAAGVAAHQLQAADELRVQLEERAAEEEARHAAELDEARAAAALEKEALERVAAERLQQKQQAEEEADQIAEALEEERERRTLLQTMHEKESASLRQALHKATGFRETKQREELLRRAAARLEASGADAAGRTRLRRMSSGSSRASSKSPMRRRSTSKSPGEGPRSCPRVECHPVATRLPPDCHLIATRLPPELHLILGLPRPPHRPGRRSSSAPKLRTRSPLRLSLSPSVGASRIYEHSSKWASARAALLSTSPKPPSVELGHAIPQARRESTDKSPLRLSKSPSLVGSTSKRLLRKAQSSPASEGASLDQLLGTRASGGSISGLSSSPSPARMVRLSSVKGASIKGARWARTANAFAGLH